MSVSDLAHETAKRYCAAVPVRDWVVALLERLDVPPSAREPVHVDALTQWWRRVLEEQLVQHYSVAELAAVARFYSTPEAQSLMQKMVAFTTLVTPPATAIPGNAGSDSASVPSGVDMPSPPP